MSKIGSYIIDQIEQGNFTVDERGNYNVELTRDRKFCTTATPPASNSFCGNESRRQRINKARKRK